MMIFNKQSFSVIHFDNPIMHRNGIKTIIIYNENKKIECMLQNTVKVDYSFITKDEIKEINKLIKEEIKNVTSEIFYRKNELKELYKMIKSGDIYNQLIIDLDHFTPDDYINELKNEIDNNNKKLKALSVILNKHIKQGD